VIGRGTAESIGWEQSRVDGLEGGLRNALVWEQGVVPTRKHPGSKLSHYGLSLDVQIAQHFVGAPAATNEADAIRIDVGAKECHGAGSAERACGNIERSKTVLCAQ
jgi:hypothetical protein